jgi:hypothetical protein
MHAIASIQATEMTRRAVNGAGPGDAVAERAPRRSRRSRRAAATRPARTVTTITTATTSTPAPGTRHAPPVRTVNVLDV